MNPAMNHVIGIEQNGFVPARFIAENNMLLHEIIEYTKKHYTKKGGLLLFLDFEKAFDRVDHDFMLQVLDRMAFPSEFINWIQLLYTSSTTSVRINNINSKALNLNSGVRQGCPISPLLFACVVECMANMIRNDPSVKGIISPFNKEIKLSQYADDTVLVLQDWTSFTNCKKHIDVFCLASGMKLNKDKTEGMWLGKHSHDGHSG